VIFLCALFSAAAGDAADFGVPGWSCDADLMKKSKSVPKSVHSLRPADIDIVGAIGDSMTAANGAGAEENDILGVAIQYRGLTFSVGGDKTLDEHITMANILKKFNPNLFGFSIRTGSANVWETAKLNAGIPGAHSWEMEEQANDLVRRIKEHPEVDYKNQWKLIHIFIGANDVCRWCVHQQDESADSYRDNIRKAVQVLQRELPKTIVVLTGIVDVGLLRKNAIERKCQVTHALECECVAMEAVTDQMLLDITAQYAQKEQELEDSGEFDTADDFTLAIQPYFEKVDDLYRNVRSWYYSVLVSIFPSLLSVFQPDGTPYMDFFAPDCFHFSAFGHSVAGKSLWNNMMEPVGSKSTANFTDISNPLLCPDASCPFIRTTKNSKDCNKY
ncbi:hypothetical protein PMAYCL1PPCAC_25351, partial [Pristionchus mayeri]